MVVGATVIVIVNVIVNVMIDLLAICSAINLGVVKPFVRETSSLSLWGDHPVCWRFCFGVVPLVSYCDRNGSSDLPVFRSISVHNL